MPCALGTTALSSREEPYRYKEMRLNHPGQPPRMAEVATAQPLLLENSWKNPARKNERREKRRTEHPRERQARRPFRGSWNVTPAAWKNSQVKVGLRGALACWHSGFWAVAQVRVCSDTEPLVELPQLARCNPLCSKPCHACCLLCLVLLSERS